MNKLYDFFLFNQSGICVLEKQIKTLFADISEYNNYKLIIKRISHTLLMNYQNIKPNDNLENEFIFKNIQNEKYKILFMIKNNFILVGTFPYSSSIQFQRLLLMHIFIALINFKGDFISCVDKLNEYEDYDNNNYMNLKTFYDNKKSTIISKDTNDILEILIFEYYFLKSLINHFLKVFNEMFRKKDVNLKQIKLKNVYLLDVNSNKVILDMIKIQGGKSSQKNKKYYKFERLFEEILYHSKHLYNSYIREFDMKFTKEEEDFRFVKFECTSTYPRLLFIIRFIPVLKGIVIIHLYEQTKLSRNNENSIQTQQGINFKEVDLLFGSFIKENPNLEFKYGAPKKLIYIEKFIEEFFITNRKDIGVFRLNNANKSYKYVNYSVIKIINSCHISSNAMIDDIFNDFNKKLKEEFIIEKSEDKENKSENETKSIDNILELNNESLYNEIFEDSQNKNSKLSNGKASDNKVLISKIDLEDSSIKNNNNNINENLNINDIINSNSERKVLIDNITSSFNESKDEYKIKKDKLIFENSKLSNVKMNEKFVLKIVNKQEQKNKKENSKELISNKSEKEYKLDEMLELISANKKFNIIKKGNTSFQEDSKDNELTHKEIQNSKSKNNSGPIKEKTN